MKNNNFITIQGWMVNDLKLSGNELICYALIYGFTQDEESEFRGSLQYISDWLGISKQNVRLIIKRLVEKGLIIQRDEFINNVKFCRYTVCMKQPQGMNVSFMGGGNETATDNNSNNNTDNKEDTNVSKKESKKKTTFSEDVEYLYSLYPSKCPNRNMGTGKSSNDKKKLESLLKTMPKEELEFTIKSYVEESLRNDSFLKNFSTLLNNLPDMGYLKEQPIIKAQTSKYR